MRKHDTTSAIALGLDATTSIEAILDTRGFRHARIACMANTEVALGGTNRLLESDDADAFSEIPETVAGSAYAASTILANTNAPRIVYDIDLRGRKRFIKVQYETAETTLPFVVTELDMPLLANTTTVQVFSGEFGTGSAGRFIRDAIRGRDSVDIVVVGDSNAGFNGGYGRAWNSQMVAAGAPLYGCGIVPCANGGSVGAAVGTYTTVGIVVFNGRTVGQTSGVSWLALGATAGISAIDDIWNNGSSTLMPFSGSGTTPYGVNWIYYETGSNDTTTNFSIEVQAACPTPPNEDWITRVGYVTFDSGSGSFVNRWTIDASPYTTLAAEQFETNTGTVGYAIAETAIGANPSRTSDIKASRYNAGGSGGTLYPNTLTAPAGFLFESVYVKKRGFAVTQLQYRGGATTTGAVEGVTDSGDTITTYLREIRERQIAAGGTGRVVFWLNTGVNGGPAAASDWSTGADELRDNIKTRWASLGYPSQDLAFLFSVSHVTADPDTMSATRSTARGWVNGKADATVVDLSLMASNAALTALSYYDAGGNQHLTESGYSYTVRRIIATIATDSSDTNVVRI